MIEQLLYDDVWLDVEYDYYAGCEGTSDVPSSPARVKLFTVYLGDKDIYELLSDNTIEAMEEKILEETYGV